MRRRGTEEWHMVGRMRNEYMSSKYWRDGEDRGVRDE